MKRIKSKVVQDFIGTINDKTIYNEDLYYNIESLLDTLWDKLKNIDIPKENELINDFIDSISNIYKLSDITKMSVCQWQNKLFLFLTYNISCMQ